MKFTVAVVLLIGTALPATAQFEGKIVFNSYKADGSDPEQRDDRFTMFLTPERIMIQGAKSYNVIGSIPTEGILVRLDFEDFVFLTGDETAMKISRNDIDMMVKMMSGGSNGRRGSVSDAELNYRNTGETQEIHGYNCEKFIFRDPDDPNEHAEVWMTTDLKVNWGMLSENWGNSQLDMMGDRLSFDLIFKQGYFPLRIEGYKSGSLTDITEVEEISRSNIARAMVQVPQGVRVLSFQDYLFNSLGQ